MGRISSQAAYMESTGRTVLYTWPSPLLLLHPGTDIDRVDGMQVFSRYTDQTVPTTVIHS